MTRPRASLYSGLLRPAARSRAPLSLAAQPETLDWNPPADTPAAPGHEVLDWNVSGDGRPEVLRQRDALHARLTGDLQAGAPLTLSIDAERHQRLRRAAEHAQCTAQQVALQAIDAFLESTTVAGAPECPNDPAKQKG